jgi:hypothetical protein
MVKYMAVGKFVGWVKGACTGDNERQRSRSTRIDV